MNLWLLAGAAASGLASVLHLLCIVGGEAWYRAVGAGERMARAVATGELRPHLVTAAIAVILAVWALYALSGAGVIQRLPLLQPILVAITAAYLARAAALPMMLRLLPDRSRHFLVVSSIIVLAIGAIHAVGLAAAWEAI